MSKHNFEVTKWFPRLCKFCGLHESDHDVLMSMVERREAAKVDTQRVAIRDEPDAV